MRKGFTLVEMIVVIMVLPFVFLIMDGLFRTLLSDIPRSYSIAQENTTLLNMLEQLRQDIERAEGLPASFAEHAANDNMLLIASEDGVISYQLKDGQAVRRKLTGAQRDSAEESRVWSLPHATVVWKVWTKDGKGYAVETKAHIEQNIRGQWKQKMANSHLYFAGSFGKAPVQK
ncbi:MAG: PulJ/GspJ family protein [Planctomycetota bacterium]|jgi:prepilin-type N-terminal cleavage/methylation domain-containing protein